MWAPFYAVLLSVLTYYSVLKEFANEMSDYCGHVYSYIPLLSPQNLPEGWMSIPYCLWHIHVIILHKIAKIPVEPAAAIASCFFTLLSFGILYWIISRFTKTRGIQCSSSLTATLAFALCIIQRIAIPWADIAGEFTINTLHNPTQMCVRPFSLLCFVFTYDIFMKLDNENYVGTFIDMSKGLKKAYVALAVTLFFSGMAKPTFAEMFIPTVGLLMLYGWGLRLVKKTGTAKVYFKELVTMFLVAVPTLLYILLQFLAYFVWGGSYGLEESHMVLTKWMEVWSMFSDNIPLSILVAMGFPLFVILIDAGFFFKDHMGRIALLGYAVSLLEAGFLTEETKMSHGDFLWPMMSGMLLLWVVSLLHFLHLCHRNAASTAVSDKGAEFDNSGKIEKTEEIDKSEEIDITEEIDKSEKIDTNNNSMGGIAKANNEYSAKFCLTTLLLQIGWGIFFLFLCCGAIGFLK